MQVYQQQLCQRLMLDKIVRKMYRTQLLASARASIRIFQDIIGIPSKNAFPDKRGNQLSRITWPTSRQTIRNMLFNFGRSKQAKDTLKSVSALNFFKVTQLISKGFATRQLSVRIS